jgi:nitrite reductase/ring-hydroxylating ferredoxin subunit
LCELDELSADQGKYVEIDGFHLGVYLNGGDPSTLDDRCPHAGASLSAGCVEEECAVCPLHGWMFRLETGQLKGTPGVAVTHYKTRVHAFGGKQFVQADLPIP